MHTEATARAFDVSTTLLNIGSNLALIGVATILTEILLLNVHKRKSYCAGVTKEERVKELVAINQNQVKAEGQVNDSQTAFGQEKFQT